MAEPHRYERTPGWVWRRLRGAVLVMGPDRTAHQLEGAAALVWLCLDRPGSRHDIVDRGGPSWSGPGAAPDSGSDPGSDPERLAQLGIEALVDVGAVVGAPEPR